MKYENQTSCTAMGMSALAANQKAPPQVTYWLANLSTALGDLEDAIIQLGQRIEPICCTCGERAKADSPPQPVLAPIADGLRDKTLRVQSMTERVQHMLNSIEL